MRPAILLLALSTLGPAGLRAAPAPDPEAAAIERYLGEATFQGGWSRRYPLGSSPGLHALGIDLSLNHAVAVDPRGRAESAWTVPRLEACALPAPAGEWIIRLPTGEEIRRPREGEAADLAVRSRFGASYRFHRGLLAGIDDPRGGALAVETRGALLARIGAPGREPELAAGYDRWGRLVRLKLAGQPEQAFEWSEGLLRRWRRGTGADVVFSYRDRLLALIDDPGRPAALSWQSHPDFGRGDCPWPIPVQVVSDGSRDYSFRLESGGAELTLEVTTRFRASGAEAVTVFDTALGKLTQHQPDGRVRTVIFSRSDPYLPFSASVFDAGGRLTGRFTALSAGQP